MPLNKYEAAIADFLAEGKIVENRAVLDDVATLSAAFRKTLRAIQVERGQRGPDGNTPFPLIEKGKGATLDIVTAVKQRNPDLEVGKLTAAALILSLPSQKQE